MKKFYFLLALLLPAAMIFAQGNSTKNDPAATKILNAVSAKFKTYKTVTANFTYKVENAAGKVLSTQTGKVMMKGNKYRISFAGQEIYSDGKTVWNYDKNANEVTVSNLDASGAAITPQKLFTNFYDKDFYSLLRGEKKAGSRTVQEIEMTPVDKSKPFHKVYVQVDKGTNTIFSTKMLEKSGNRYTYTVTSMKPNAAIADNIFVFNKASYPGVELVDLR